MVAAGTCPGEACLNLSAFSFIGGGGCLCDGAALAAVLHEATHARRELVYTLIGALCRPAPHGFAKKPIAVQPCL